MQYIIYDDIEFLISKIDCCENKPENSSTMKIREHILCGLSMSTIWGFDRLQNKHTLYCGKDCMKNFCDSLREHAKNIIAFEEKMLPLAKEELKSYQEAKLCYICRKGILEKLTEDKNYGKVRDHSYFTGNYRDAAHNICNLKFNVPQVIPLVFHRASNYDYHFIIKELANEFQGELGCLGENKEKYKTLSISIRREVKKIDKDGNESVTTISYKRKVIDSARFMVSSFSNLVDNLTERVHKIRCKDCDCFLKYESV